MKTYKLTNGKNYWVVSGMHIGWDPQVKRFRVHALHAPERGRETDLLAMTAEEHLGSLNKEHLFCLKLPIKMRTKFYTYA